MDWVSFAKDWGPAVLIIWLMKDVMLKILDILFRKENPEKGDPGGYVTRYVNSTIATNKANADAISEVKESQKGLAIAVIHNYKELKDLHKTLVNAIEGLTEKLAQHPQTLSNVVLELRELLGQKNELDQPRSEEVQKEISDSNSDQPDN